MSLHIAKSGAVVFSIIIIGTGCGQSDSTYPEPLTGSTPAPALTDLTPDSDTVDEPANLAPAPAFDFEASQRPVNEEGEAFSDLDTLNQILTDYREARASVSLPPRRYRTEAEQMAAEAAHERAVQAAAQVTDLSELVKAGVIKALPTPPAGQRYVIDPKTHRVVLVSVP